MSAVFIGVLKWLSVFISNFVQMSMQTELWSQCDMVIKCTTTTSSTYLVTMK